MLVQLPLTMFNLDSVMALGYEARRTITGDFDRGLAAIQVATTANNFRIASRRPSLPYITIDEFHAIELLESLNHESALEYAEQFRNTLWEKQ